MYMRIARYRRAPDADLEEMVRRMQSDFVPLIRRQAGFRAYWADDAGDGTGTAVSIFKDKASLEGARRTTLPWTTEKLGRELPDPPTVRAGEVRHHVVAPGWGEGGDGGALPHATIREYGNMSGDPDRVVAMVREHTLPIITAAPGFRCYFTCFDEGEARFGIGVSLFDSREEADRASDRVIAAMREKGIESRPPRVVSGRVRVLATTGGW
jgi:hypothetical protein